MVIFSGWGILVVPITLLVGGAVTALLVALLDAAGLERLGGFAVGAGLLAAAGATWWAGRWLNGGTGRVLLDPATGQHVVLRRSHSLFFVPMQWWAVPLAFAGAFILLASVLGPVPAGTGSAPDPAARAQTP